MALRFFSEGLSFKLPHPRKTSSWLKEAIASEGYSSGELTFIFCNDTFLQSINKTYLNHEDLTDIITFDYSQDKVIGGDIYISIQRVKENALNYSVSFDDELHRVMVHGVLHLMGYKDKKKSEIALMRKKEEAYLSLRTK